MTDRITDASKKIGRPQIREVFMRNGAHIEPGRDDLPDWVYESVFELLELAAPAVQQPAPDVAGLVEALSIARDYVFSSLEEKKLALAGYPQMWRCEQDDLAMIDATLSTYRKETSHDK